jgi:hypothetical protein
MAYANTRQTRQKLKEAYAAEFAATIERAEKQIILARHGRRLLNLLDDTPVVPGDVRPAYEHSNQARQILNDAEDDLRDWQPELEDVPSSAQLESNLMPREQHQQIAQSDMGDESVLHHQHAQGGSSETGVDGSRISSGGSVTTGQPLDSYAPSESEATRSQVA